MITTHPPDQAVGRASASPPVDRGRNPFRAILRFFASLRLTVVCLGAGMVLIFAGTLAQVHLGIHAAQAVYFRSLFVYWTLPGTHFPVPIFPGGYLLGGVLLINLIAAHFTRFKLTPKKAGIMFLHLGVLLLLVGELLTGLFARETLLRLDEAQTKLYSEAPREVELAIIDTTNPEYDQVVAIPEKMLARGKAIQHPQLPFTLQVRQFMANSTLNMRAPDSPPSLATTGLGSRVTVRELPRTVKADERDISSAFVELQAPQGTLGTWLVSNGLGAPQPVTYAGHAYQLVMRQRRDYKPFAITLLDFRHDIYPGTDVPKNFSSRIRLVDSAKQQDREVLISMNAPLRYGGYTFYQAGFENQDTTSILQVVRNPAFVLPYVACGLVALGLVVQFSMHLFGFLRRRVA